MDFPENAMRLCVRSTSPLVHKRAHNHPSDIKSNQSDSNQVGIHSIPSLMTCAPLYPFSVLTEFSGGLQLLLSNADRTFLDGLSVSWPRLHFDKDVNSAPSIQGSEPSDLSLEKPALSPIGEGSDRNAIGNFGWIQLTGHPGSLLSTGTGSVLKAFNECEASCLRVLQSDALSMFVPSYEGLEMHRGRLYVRMQDLLYTLQSPSVMDCKMGQRTYLEEEVIENSHYPARLRPDMYDKMVAVDPSAPTLEEDCLQAVSKIRYMRWRETLSTTAKLGFRIEAIKKANAPALRNFQRICSKDQVKELFMDFVQSSSEICRNYVQKLETLRSTLALSAFFAEHELIGSSLLFAHDVSDQANVWMIDFAKTSRVHNLRLDHRKPWKLGNHEDGYLLGLDNMIDLFTEIQCELY